MRNILWAGQRTWPRLLLLFINQYNAQDAEVILSVRCTYQAHSECWTRGGVLICCTNYRSRESTDSGARAGTEQKTREPRDRVCTNLGRWAHGGQLEWLMQSSEEAGPCRRGQTLVRLTGLTHLGSIWELPVIIRILDSGTHFPARGPSILKIPPSSLSPVNEHHWSKWHFGFSDIEVWPEMTGTLSSSKSDSHLPSCLFPLQVQLLLSH